MRYGGCVDHPPDSNVPRNFADSVTRSSNFRGGKIALCVSLSIYEQL